MKKILGLLTALLLATPVMADDVAVGAGSEGTAGNGAWIVMDSEIYWCRLPDGRDGHPLCKKAKMKN